MKKGKFEVKSRDYRTQLHFIMEYGDINIHSINIFCILFDSREELMEKWEEFNNDIAYEYQSKLDKDVERFNIYCFYFIREKVSVREKIRIEQDKYATRKYIVDGFDLTNNIENEIERVVFDKLFNLKISKSSKQTTKNIEYNELVQELLEELSDFGEQISKENQLGVVRKIIRRCENG